MEKSRPPLPDLDYGLARRFAAKRLLRRMLARQRIRLDSIAWRESENIVYRALHTCSRCTEKPACIAWLAKTEPPIHYVGFCPNAEQIEALRIMPRSNTGRQP